MRLTAASLRDALKATAPAISGRPAMPILAAVRVLVQAGEVTLSATDYEVWISSTIAGTTIDEGEAWSGLVSHRTLSTIAKVIKAKEVDLRLDGGKLVIAAGGANWTTPLLTGALPNDPAMPGEVGTVAADTLRHGVRMTAPAAGTESIFPMLLPVVIAAHGDYLRFTCTDRYRVHVADIVFERLTEAPIYALPPARALAQIAESLSGTVTLRADSESGLFGASDGSTAVLIRTIDATAPPVDAVLEATSTNGRARTTLVPGELIDAVRAALATDEDTGVLLTIAKDGSTIATSGDDGTSVIPLDITDHDGDGIVVRVNGHFLTDALTAVGGDTVQIDWVSPTKPALITSSGRPGRCLVMPVRDVASRWLSEKP